MQIKANTQVVFSLSIGRILAGGATDLGEGPTVAVTFICRIHSFIAITPLLHSRHRAYKKTVELRAFSFFVLDNIT